jgi:hypothetical protein
VAEKGGKGPIFEANMLPQKMYPQNWRQYWRHNRNPVKDIIADLVVSKSSNDPTLKAGTDSKAKFLELPFKWKDNTLLYHTILSAKDLAKAIQASIADPHSSHSFYKKELVLYIPTSGLFCSRESTPDCKDLSKILNKAPPALTKAKLDVITAISVSGAADAIAN